MSTSETTADSSTGYHTIDSEIAENLKDNFDENCDFNNLEEKLKVLSNQNRLKILAYLREQDLCVHDLTTLMNLSQSAISHQLKELRNQGIVNRRKEGRVVYYSPDEKKLQTLREELSVFLQD